MELDEFAMHYPELYVMLDEDIRYMIAENKITGEESLNDWDDMITNIVKKHDQQEYYEYDKDVVMAQQFNDGFRDRDRRPFRRRRHLRDFNLRDIARLLFLRKLFDRDFR